MSKKFEVIRNAVFYSQQEPEKLAKLLEGTISDVATSVTVAGDSSVVIPLGDTATTKTYTASVLSQYGDVMEGQSVTWSIPETTGVSIGSSTGILEVAKTASAGKVTITATCSGKTATKEVTLTAGT